MEVRLQYRGLNIIDTEPRYGWEVVFIVGVLAQFLWEAQAHKVSGRYIIGNC